MKKFLICLFFIGLVISTPLTTLSTNSRKIEETKVNPNPSSDSNKNSGNNNNVQALNQDGSNKQPNTNNEAKSSSTNQQASGNTQNSNSNGNNGLNQNNLQNTNNGNGIRSNNNQNIQNQNNNGNTNNQNSNNNQNNQNQNNNNQNNNGNMNNNNKNQNNNNNNNQQQQQSESSLPNVFTSGHYKIHSKPVNPFKGQSENSELKSKAKTNVTLEYAPEVSYSVVKNGVIDEQFKENQKTPLEIGEDTLSNKVTIELAKINNDFPNVSYIDFIQDQNMSVVQPYTEAICTSDFYDTNKINCDLIIHYNCFISNGNVLLTIVPYIKYNSGFFTTKFTYMVKCKEGPIPQLLVNYHGSKGQLVIKDGYVSSSFKNHSNIFTEGTGSISYFTVTVPDNFLSTTISWSAKVENNLFEVTLSGDATDEKDPNRDFPQTTTLEVLYNGKSDSTAIVTIIGRIGGNEGFDAGDFVDNIFDPSTEFLFQYKKHFEIGPIPGFDIIEKGSKALLDNYVILSDGIINSDYSSEDPQVILPAIDPCMQLYFRGRYDNITYKPISVSYDNSQMTINTYGDAINGYVSKNSVSYGLCHLCKDDGEYKVTISIEVTHGYKNSDISHQPLKFGYIKKCSQSLLPIDITTGMYVPKDSQYYAVRHGITQLPYQIGNRKMVSRYDEDKTRFYISSTKKIDISYPQVKVIGANIDMTATVSLVGYSSNKDFDNDLDIMEDGNPADDNDKVTLYPDADAIIMEIFYTCDSDGQYPIVVSIGINDTSISFSWMKKCRSKVVDFIVGSDYEQVEKYINADMKDGNGDYVDSYDLANDVVDKGVVNYEYNYEFASKTIDEDTIETKYYVAAKKENRLMLREKPQVIVHNNDILTVIVSGDLTETTEVTNIPHELGIIYQCKRKGSSRIDVNLMISKYGSKYGNTMFSFTKVCRSPKSYNWTFIKDVFLLVLSIVVLLLLYPALTVILPNASFLKSSSFVGIKEKRLLDKDL